MSSRYGTAEASRPAAAAYARYLGAGVWWMRIQHPTGR
jgi:hypothetical protein